MYNTGMLKENCLKGAHYIVSGGGSGLGFSMSKYLVQLGASITIISRNEERLKKACEELKKINQDVHLKYYSCDIRESQDIDDIVAQVFKKNGKVDGVINNAAGNFISPTENLSSNAFSSVIDIVLKGTCNLTLSYGKKCIEKSQKGKILNIITTYALTGSGYVVPSAAAKGGVLSLTRSIAAEWSKYKIYCNAIAPGPFPTKGAWDKLFPKPISMFFDMEKRLPLKRYGDHQELANLAAFMLSDFSDYINGEVITIDGAEWVSKAGQFNMLNKVPKKVWPMISKMTRKNK
ncbi:MAG: SDR family oxidoreductase [Pelagibacteraceae bacterium TMED124]|nr:short-chain dehydrogenase [Candidatus Neomarinimicrobiota bacterium]RPG17365.1 MAG: SDR family oxidoreductase [Pelagibacteraceae bacterium TMED124]